MLYTVTIVDDRNNQKLHGQSWDEVANLFGCLMHGLNVSLECATCTLQDEILDALAESETFGRRTVEYSEYYDGYVSCYVGVEKED